MTENGIAEIADSCRQAAGKLHSYLVSHHIDNDGAVVGPDVGVRFNLRVWRFVKSYLSFLPWRDTYYYTQGQTYWILSNLELHKLTNDASYLDLALKCADTMLSKQMPEGCWEFPQNEWKGVFATVETCFGGLGLLAAFEAIKDDRYLSAAIRTYGFIVKQTGFQKYDEDSLAVNYFSNRGRGLVPNNSTLAVWFCAALKHATGDSKYLDDYCAPMINFLIRCQCKSGELPYSLISDQGNGRDHYQCFQYNSFQFMDMVEYYRITRDDKVLPMMHRMAGFLSTGLTELGDIRADCMSDWPIRNYCTAAISAALSRATQAGLGEYTDLAICSYKRLISLQRKDGGFDFSTRDYRFLSDRRSYPRVMCMILRHLLIGAELGASKNGEADGIGCKRGR